MSTENRFKQSVVTTLAKRAANRCSNPECNAITSGPTDDPNNSVNVGEAAHIYGANQGSARYDSNMETTDRSAISNAIWLCSNCHKVIDDDPVKYPAGLLFEWQREHERQISAKVGKTSAEIKQRYENRHLEEFGKLSYLAERLILEKEDYWEYKLTAEMLRHEMAPTIQRWKALKRGLYVKPITRIDKDDFIEWFLDRIHEILEIIKAFNELTNIEFSHAWGEPGTSGRDTQIVTTCRLYAEVCKSTLSWEESVRFIRVDDAFLEVHNLFIGIAGGIIEQAEKIPQFLSKTLENTKASGTFKLELIISVPDGWDEKINTAMKQAMQNA